MTAPGTHSQLDRPPQGLRIATARDGADVVIRLEGELDMATAPPVRDEFLRALTLTSVGVVIDLRALGFLDSTGIHALVQLHERCTETQRRLKLVLGPGPVRRVLSVSGLLEAFDTVTEEAVAA